MKSSCCPDRLKLKFVCVLFASQLMVGCGKDPTEVHESFQDLADTGTLPEGWELQMQSGEYRIAGSKESRQGDQSLVFGGAGGAANLLGPPTKIPASTAVVGDLWIKPKSFDEGEVQIGFDFVGLETANPSTSAGLVSVDLATEEWTNYKIYGLPPQSASATPQTARLNVHLQGDGLLLIDNADFTFTPITPGLQLKDGGFESPDSKGSYPEWRIAGEKEKVKALASTEKPYRGARALRIEGPGQWGVAVSKLDIPAANHEVSVRAQIKSQEGVGYLKIEYYKGDQRLEETYSDSIDSREWQEVSISSNLAKMNQADRVCVTLAASARENDHFSVDFDEVSVIVTKTQ